MEEVSSSPASWRIVSGDLNIGVAPRRLAMQRGQYSGARRGTRGSGIDSPQREQFRYVMAGLEVEGTRRGRR